MRVLFCAWHMHSNQNGWVSSLIDNGHTVRYLIQYKSLSDYPGDFKPDFIPPISKRTSTDARTETQADAYWLRRRRMFPNLGEICRLILDYKPDVIVIRELSTTGMIVFAIGHLVTRRFVRYIQHPAFCVSSPGRAKRTFAKRFFDSLFRCTITPVMGTGAVPRIPGIRFVPFTVPGTAAPLERKYVAGGTVRFFSIGKFFATRKGHAILIRALDNLAEEFDFRLTLFGGVRSEEDSNYQEIIELVKSSRIASRTTVRTNVPNDECRLEYLSQDVFVLPSSGEPAAYSPFEAISFGLPVVCTTENGTRYVIEEGKNGFLVPPNDVDALAKALRAFLADPSLIESMGKQSSRISSDKYSSRAVYPKLIEALNA